MTFPKLGDPNFNEKIAKKYKDYKIPKSSKTYDQWCNSRKYTLQLPQQFLAKYINPNTPYSGVLIYHKIGSGKTCTAIQIAEQWKKRSNIVVVVPASLRGNFRNELRSQCAGNIYLTENQRKELAKLDPGEKKYTEIINASDEKINEYYDIYSYEKFVQSLENGNLSLKNTLLIIDEIQNMISEFGTRYNILYDSIKKGPKDLRLVLLSATPMFDKPNELALTLNLLNLPKELPIGKEFNKTFIRTVVDDNGKHIYKAKNMDLFKTYIKGFISYYQGAPKMTFPKTHIKYVDCVMSDFQYETYKNVAKYEELYSETGLTNDFYIGSRMVSNIVFPNKKINDNGFKMLTDDVILKHLNKYSCKFAKIMERIEQTSGKIFVYSNFKEYGGLASFIKVLEAYGYTNYNKAGPGAKSFAIWTGDESDIQKNEIRDVFNHRNNITGKNIKILLGSSAIKEGVTLLNVKQAHIIDGYWNWNKIKQIIGRVSRFCSHKDMPENKRVVNIYMYLAVAKNENIETIDKYMNTLALEKDKLISKFEKAIKTNAIDCKNNYNANVDSDDDYVCDK